MEKIKEQFVRKGFTYTLLKRVGNIVLYEQFKKVKQHIDPVTNKPTFGPKAITQYEIHKVRLSNARTCKYEQSDGSVIVIERLEQEILASDKEFGKYGWSFQHKEDAMKFFDNKVIEEEKINRER